MSGELTAADVSWCVRSEAVIQDALRGATVLEVSGRGNGWHNATVQQDFVEGS